MIKPISFFPMVLFVLCQSGYARTFNTRCLTQVKSQITELYSSETCSRDEEACRLYRNSCGVSTLTFESNSNLKKMTLSCSVPQGFDASVDYEVVLIKPNTCEITWRVISSYDDSVGY